MTDPPILYATIAGVSATVVAILGGTLTISALGMRQNRPLDAAMLEAAEAISASLEAELHSYRSDLESLRNLAKEHDDVSPLADDLVARLTSFQERNRNLIKIASAPAERWKAINETLVSLFALFVVGVTGPIVFLANSWNSSTAMKSLTIATLVCLWFVFMAFVVLIHTEASGYPTAEDVEQVTVAPRLSTSKRRSRLGTIKAIAILGTGLATLAAAIVSVLLH